MPKKVKPLSESRIITDEKIPLILFFLRGFPFINPCHPEIRFIRDSDCFWNNKSHTLVFGIRKSRTVGVKCVFVVIFQRNFFNGKFV